MNIESILLENEQILYSGIAVPKKGSKSILGLTIIILFCLIPFIALIDATKVNILFNIEQIVIIILVTILFFALGIYGLIYNLFLKGKKIKGQQYFITNQRAIIYSKKKNEFKIGHLNRFDELRVDNEKNNFGDVYMGIIPEDINPDISTVSSLLFNRDKNNMNVIVFEAVENPYQILELARKQRINLVPDKPIFNNYREGQKEVKVGGQKVIIYDNPKWVWLLFSGIIILLLAFPTFNLMSTLKIWNNYTKTTAIVTNIDKQYFNSGGGSRNQNRDIKYFVNITYTVDSKNYEGIITNDKSYLKSIQNDTFGTTHSPKYNSQFSKMQKNDKVDVYINPNNPTDVEYIPTLISGANTILLIIGLIGLVFIVAIIKAQIQNIKK